ncbi:unnamed protein product [Cochlearia groenlandica]
MKQTYMSLRHGGRLRSILRIIVEQVLEICYGSGKMVMVPQLSEGFFIDEEKKVAMGFDEIDYPNKFNIIGEDGYVRELDFEVHDTGYDPIKDVGGNKSNLSPLPPSLGSGQNHHLLPLRDAKDPDDSRSVARMLLFASTTVIEEEVDSRLL